MLLAHRGLSRGGPGRRLLDGQLCREQRYKRRYEEEDKREEKNGKMSGLLALYSPNPR